jgi:hypothetical protein
VWAGCETLHRLSTWPVPVQRGIKVVFSAAAHLLRSWVRIPPGAWIEDEQVILEIFEDDSVNESERVAK